MGNSNYLSLGAGKMFDYPYHIVVFMSMAKMHFLTLLSGTDFEVYQEACVAGSTWKLSEDLIRISF